MMERDSARRERIRLVETLWDMECRRLLGALSTPEYRQALAALRHRQPAGTAPEQARCEELLRA